MEIGSREAIREAVIRGLGIATVSEIGFVPDPRLATVRIVDADVQTHANVACRDERRTRASSLHSSASSNGCSRERAARGPAPAVPATDVGARAYFDRLRFARGCAASYTFASAWKSRCVYTCVLAIDACPSISCTARRSPDDCSTCDANE